MITNSRFDTPLRSIHCRRTLSQSAYPSLSHTNYNTKRKRKLQEYWLTTVHTEHV